MRKLSVYIVRRIAWIFFVIFIVVTITYILSMVVPANPVLLWVGPKATKAQIEKAKRYLGLDKPPVVRYFLYWERFLKGDWGLSYQTRKPVLDDIVKRWPATMELGLFAMLLSIVIGMPLGILAGVRHETSIDHGSRIFSLTGVAIPSFWLGIMLQLLFSSWLKVLPLTGRIDPKIDFTPITGFYLWDSLIQGNWLAFQSALSHIILPSLALATAPMAIIMRVTRGAVLEILTKDHIKTLLMYGLPRKLILLKYILKTASLPVVTVVGLEFGYILAGDFVVEYVFDWPGLGMYAAQACVTLDYPAILGTVVVVAITFVVINMIVDLVYAFLDPRIRY